MIRALALILAVTVTIAMFWQSGSKVDAERSSLDPVSDTPTPEPRSQGESASSVERNNFTNELKIIPADDKHTLLRMRERYKDEEYDPMLVFASDKFSDEEIAAYNELHVIPFNPVVRVHCNEFYDPEHDITGKECSSERQRPPHVYENYTDQELIELAETDPVAAIILSRRVGFKPQELELNLRATALSGKPGPLLLIAQRYYSHFSTSTRTPEGWVHERNPELLKQRVALEMVANALGDPRAEPKKWRRYLINSDMIEDAAQGLSEADAYAINWLNRMAEIQRNYTGSTQMVELIETPTAPEQQPSIVGSNDNNDPEYVQSQLNKEIESAKQAKAAAERVRYFELAANRDFRQYIMDVSGVREMFLFNDAMNELIRSEFPDLQARANSSRPLTESELSSLWAKVESSHGEVIEALKKGVDDNQTSQVLEQLRQANVKMMISLDRALAKPELDQ